MNSLLLKKIITICVLASFLAVALFSFAVMMHSSDGRLAGDCPFSALGQSVCPGDSLNLALHYVSTYSAFFNVSIVSSLSAFIISLLAGLFALLAIYGNLSQAEFQPAFASIKIDDDFRRRRLTRWLSLLENSPSRF